MGTGLGRPLRLVSAVVAALLVWGTGASAGDADTKKTKLVDYQSERGGFTIGLPKGWERKEWEPAPGMWMLEATRPRDGDGFSENINVITVPPSAKDLKEQNQKGIAFLKQRMPGFNLIEEGFDKLGENDVAWFIHAHAHQGRTFKAAKYSILHGGKLYIITCTALPDTFGRYATVFKDIASSVRFDAAAKPAGPPEKP